MKNKQHDNLKKEQKRALEALTTLQTREYTVEQKIEIDESIKLTFEEIIREIESYIEEMKEDPEKMEAMIQQFARISEETPTHWRFENRVYCEKCFIKLMMDRKGTSFDVRGVTDPDQAHCDVCGG